MFFKNKKAQLGFIEFKFFIFGLILGLVVAFLLIFLANNGTLPFRMEFVCPAPAK
jgi:hypothetical protein|tara:strand:+ start:440 stop:604 length:165 start_codon:yes stop_codon:yes gene_type:complete